MQRGSSSPCLCGQSLRSCSRFSVRLSVTVWMEDAASTKAARSLWVLSIAEFASMYARVSPASTRADLSVKAQCILRSVMAGRAEKVARAAQMSARVNRASTRAACCLRVGGSARTVRSVKRS